MSWFGKKSTEHVVIVLSAHNLACGWLQNNNKQRGFVLRAFEKMSFNGYVDDDSMHNTTAIGTYIVGFLERHRIKDARISCALTRPLVSERLTIKSYPTPEPRELMMTHAPHTLWDYYYMYPTDVDTYVFYVCAVAQPLLLQYKLMAFKYNLSLLITTSQTAALFQLYRYMYDQAFRMSQFGCDMRRCSDSPERLFDADVLNRILTHNGNDAIVNSNNQTTILTMCGLASEVMEA